MGHDVVAWLHGILSLQFQDWFNVFIIGLQGGNLFYGILLPGPFYGSFSFAACVDDGVWCWLLFLLGGKQHIHSQVLVLPVLSVDGLIGLLG